VTLGKKSEEKDRPPTKSSEGKSLLILVSPTFNKIGKVHSRRKAIDSRADVEHHTRPFQSKVARRRRQREDTAKLGNDYGGGRQWESVRGTPGGKCGCFGHQKHHPHPAKPKKKKKKKTSGGRSP